MAATATDTAQQRFVGFFDERLGLGRDTALQLYLKVIAYLRAQPRLWAQAERTEATDASYQAFGSVLREHIPNLIRPVMAALLGGVLALVVFESALLAAAVTLVVFAVMLFRKDGTLDSAKAWLERMLAPLRDFTA